MSKIQIARPSTWPWPRPWPPRATVHPWPMVHLSHQSQGTPSQQLLGPSPNAWPSPWPPGPQYTPEPHHTSKSPIPRYTYSANSRSHHVAPNASPWPAPRPSGLGTPRHPKVHQQRPSTLQSTYTGGQVPAKIEFYLPKQSNIPCRNPDSHIAPTLAKHAATQSTQRHATRH